MEFIIQYWGDGGPSTTPYIPNTGTTTKCSRVLYSPETRALQICKSDIDLSYQEGKWDDYKKITNPYEYVFLSWNRRSSRSVTTRFPLSRSYFKMVELWDTLDLNNYLESLVKRDGGVISAHAAEGPGGFIEAIRLRTETKDWEFVGASAITLRSEARNVPGWRKAVRFLQVNPQIQIHDGADGTGNILLQANQDAYVSDTRKRFPKGAHIYTADGGFDFSSDFNAQEDSVFSLLLAEVLLGLQTLGKGGCLIIKCFDTTEQPTLDLIWLVSRAFAQWGICKPQTSRAGNAERYLIGKGFLDDAGDIIDILKKYQAVGKFDLPILQQPIVNPEYKNVLQACMTLQAQIEHLELAVIRETLDLIKHSDPHTIKRLVRGNVLRSIQWCVAHNEPISSIWTLDLERILCKETSDLMHILHTPETNVFSSSSHFHKFSTPSSNILTFDGFRRK
jgi:23S rRNA U2552 (ribose-2'-O)-methylase RlmE/FtsJ